MKIMLLVFNMVFLLVLITVPALKRINLVRLFTVVMLMIYSIGIIKLIFLFPIPSFFSLGAGMLAVLCMAFLFRPRSARQEMKRTDHKFRMVNDSGNDVRVKRKRLIIA